MGFFLLKLQLFSPNLREPLMGFQFPLWDFSYWNDGMRKVECQNCIYATFNSLYGIFLTETLGRLVRVVSKIETFNSLYGIFLTETLPRDNQKAFWDTVYFQFPLWDFSYWNEAELLSGSAQELFFQFPLWDFSYWNPACIINLLPNNIWPFNSLYGIFLTETEDRCTSPDGSLVYRFQFPLWDFSYWNPAPYDQNMPTAPVSTFNSLYGIFLTETLR